MSFILSLLGASPAGDTKWSPGFGLGGSVQSYGSTAGERVTDDTAMSLSAYFGCLKVLAEDVAKVPMVLYRRLERGKERANSHGVYSLLRWQMCPHTSNQALRESMTLHAASWGNGYAEIERDTAGRPVALWPIHPSRVKPRHVVDPDTGGLSMVYAIAVDDVQRAPGDPPVVVKDPEDILHIRGLGTSGYEGVSVLRYAAECIGGGLAAQRFASSFWGNGAEPRMLLKHPKVLSPTVADRLREAWRAMHAGAAKANGMAVLEEGMEVEKVSISPEEAQFLETRRFSIEEVCRWFRMAPVKVQSNTATPYANIEALNIAHVTDCLMPWFMRWEEEASIKLLMPAEREAYIVEHNVATLLRGDSASRAQYYKDLSNIGALVINDVRELENQNPIDGGDTPLLQSNMTTLQAVIEGRNLSSGQPAGDRQGDGGGSKALQSVLVPACNRALSREARSLAKLEKRSDGVTDTDLAAWRASSLAVWDNELDVIESAARHLGVDTGSSARVVVQAYIHDVRTTADIITPAEMAARIMTAWSLGE